MERRNFITSIIAGATALAVLPLSFLSQPSDPRLILHGDGKHDDTDALQAWFDNETVYWPNGDEVGSIILGGHFKLSRTIYGRNRRSFGYMSNCYLQFDPPHVGSVL